MRKQSHITILDEFTVNVDKVLGQGATGCVYQGLHLKTNKKVAVKVIDLRTIDNEVAAYLLAMEKLALMTVRSPFVLQGLKIAQDSQNCLLVTEYCNGGTLKKQIQKSPSGYLSEQRSLKILHSLLLGYQQLVEKGIVHRDLKPANIMLHEGVPKIIDFGYCEVSGYAKPSLEYNVGSPSYMAPQSFHSNVYNEKTEVWSLGVILYECLTGLTLDEGRHMGEVYRQIEQYGVNYPAHVSHFCRSLINLCLSTTPKNRPTCAQLLEMFFAKRRTVSKIEGMDKVSVQYEPIRYRQHSKIFNIEPFKAINQNALNKSIKQEAKHKNYKIPQFLQASKHAKDKQRQNHQTAVSTVMPSTPRPSVQEQKHSINHDKVQTRQSTSKSPLRFRKQACLLNIKKSFKLIDTLNMGAKQRVNQQQKLHASVKTSPRGRFLSTHTQATTARSPLRQKTPKISCKLRLGEQPWLRDTRTATQRIRA